MTTSTIIQGDARYIPLADESVQCCVTSPPYYGLRDYGIDGQLGLEPTPGEYVARMVEVFREVRRVLRDDGVCWLNLGDSYNNRPWGESAGNFNDPKRRGNGSEYTGRKVCEKRNVLTDTLKPKDLVGIPWHVAFALQADGWYLRSDVIWNKPNPMPESVTDRPTKAHEYVFLLTKSARYFYDAQAVSEAAVAAEHVQKYRNIKGGKIPSNSDRNDSIGQTTGGFMGTDPTRRNLRSVWTIATRPYSGAHFATMPPDLARRCVKAGSRPGDVVLDPFAGSGTTLMVALEEGRRAVGIELNPAYIELAHQRTTVTPSLFGAEVTP